MAEDNEVRTGDSPSAARRGAGGRLNHVWRAVLAASAVVGLVAGGIAIGEFIDERLPEPILLACGTAGENQRVTRAWGPDRPGFTIEAPAPYATLNSIVDNPNYGDERSFFDVKDSRYNERGGFCNSREVRDGEILLFRFYLENSAADNLVSAGGVGPGLAEDVTVRVETEEITASLQVVTATLSSSTTIPRDIYSTVELVADFPFRLDYQVGSTFLYTSAHPQGLRLADAWNSSSLLGYQTLDGAVPPGYQYSAIGTLSARVTRVVAD